MIPRVRVLTRINMHGEQSSLFHLQKWADFSIHTRAQKLIARLVAARILEIKV